MSSGSIAAIVCTFFIVFFGALTYKTHVDADVKKACYEAAKTNQNVKCS